MKTIHFFLFFITICSLNTYGQDYQTINSRHIACFDYEQNIRFIRIDSVKYDSDSILYPFAILQDTGDGCYSPTVASWIGSKVIIKSTGENLFFNRDNDTITIQTKAKLNDKWIAFQKANMWIEAEIIQHDTLSFLGLTDSVKTITLKAFDQDTNVLDYKINNMSIQVSEKYGLIKTFNFYLFPNLSNFTDYGELKEHHLVGLSNPKVGIQNLTWFEVYDYQADDEFHIKEKNSDGENIKESKTIYKYIHRTDYADSIVYHYARKQELKVRYRADIQYYFYDDTLTSVILPNSTFDKLPEEPVFDDFSTYTIMMINENPLLKADKGNNTRYTPIDNLCWEMILADGCLPTDIYMEGLGGPYYTCEWGLYKYERILAYYKKGEITFGTPLTFTNTTNIKQNKAITIFPNPANNGQLHIVFEDITVSNCTFKLFDTNSKLIKSEKLTNTYSIVDVSALSSGFYICEISSKKKILKTEKILIE